MMRTFPALVALAALTVCGQQAPETPPTDPGAAKFVSVCQDCHGPDGQGMNRYPKLAGRTADELAARLRQYKSGHKSENMSDTMRPFAQALTEAEIDQVATWLASR